MKKIVFGLFLGAAAAVQAEYLLWTVSESDLSGSGIAASDVSYMRVGYVTENGTSATTAGNPMTAYDYGGNSMGSSDVAFDASGEDAYKIDMTNMNQANYGFYIELLNSSSQVIGRTGTETSSSSMYNTYASLSESIATGDIGSVPSVAVWHGGGFHAVPEPSSLALLALGAGLAGLRRKLRKTRKAKKGTRA